MNYEHYKIFDLVQNFIRFSDTKAGVIIAFNMSLFGAALSKLDKFDIFANLHCLKPIYFICLCVFLFSNILAIYNALISVHPSLKAEGDKSNIFFAHIAGKSLSNFTEEISGPNYSFEKDLISQIKINSDICWRKYVRISWAIKFTIASISGLLATVTIIIFS